MKTKVSVAYRCPPRTLLNALTRRCFHEEKIRALGALSCEVLGCEQSDAQLSIRIRRRMQSDMPVPRALSRVLPDVTEIEHHDQWCARQRSGQIAIALQGVPVDITMTVALRASQTGSTLDHHCVITSRLPLIGGTLERFVAKQLEHQLLQEAAVSEPLLEAYA